MLTMLLCYSCNLLEYGIAKSQKPVKESFSKRFFYLLYYIQQLLSVVCSNGQSRVVMQLYYNVVLLHCSSITMWHYYIVAYTTMWYCYNVVLCFKVPQCRGTTLQGVPPKRKREQYLNGTPQTNFPISDFSNFRFSRNSSDCHWWHSHLYNNPLRIVAGGNVNAPCQHSPI